MGITMELLKAGWLSWRGVIWHYVEFRGRAGAMKKMRILGLVGLVSSVMLTSCAMPNVAVLGDEGIRLARDASEGLKPDWNSNAFSSKLVTGFPQSDLDLLFDKFKKTLGPIQSVDAPKLVNYNMHAGLFINTPDYEAAYAIPLKCANGTATANIVAMHLNGKWQIASFNVRSPLFEKNPDLLVTPAEKRKAQMYVDELAPKLLGVWKAEFVESEADTHLRDELKQMGAGLALRGLSEASRAIGPAQLSSQPKFVNWSPSHGQDVYSFLCDAKSANSKVQLQLAVAQESGKWRLHALNIRAKSH
jgi:hypothetical protein